MRSWGHSPLGVMVCQRFDDPLSAGCAKTTTCFLICAVTRWKAPSCTSKPDPVSVCLSHLSPPCIAALLPRGSPVVRMHRPGLARSSPEGAVISRLCCLQSPRFWRGDTMKSKMRSIALITSRESVRWGQPNSKSHKFKGGPLGVVYLLVP